MTGVFYSEGSSYVTHAFPIHLPVGERYIHYSYKSNYHEQNDAIDERSSRVSAQQEYHVRHQIGEIPGPHKSYNITYPLLDVIEKTRSESSIGPTTWIDDRTKEYFPIRTEYQYIIYHRIAVNAAVVCILRQSFVCAFSCQPLTVHKSNNLRHRWFLSTDHIRI